MDTYSSAVQAMEAGAKRLELCSAIVTTGGLTPTPGMLKAVQAANAGRAHIYCLLRCRCGGFVYSPEEMAAMLEDLRLLKLAGAQGFVFGALDADGAVCLPQCRQVVKEAYPLPVTFHRAFDMCTHPLIQLEVRTHYTSYELPTSYLLYVSLIVRLAN